MTQESHGIAGILDKYRYAGFPAKNMVGGDHTTMDEQIFSTSNILRQPHKSVLCYLLHCYESMWKADSSPERDKRLKQLDRFYDHCELVWDRMKGHTRYMANRDNLDWKFARVNLTDEEKEHYTGWAEEYADDVAELLIGTLLEDYKLTVTYDNENDTWIATLSATKRSKRNKAQSLSCRHRTYQQALSLLVYKHTIICDNGVWSDHEKSDNWG